MDAMTNPATTTDTPPRTNGFLTDPDHRCDATYTSRSGYRYACDKKPHGVAAGHYFVRDRMAEAVAARTPARRHHVTIPGERS